MLARLLMPRGWLVVAGVALFGFLSLWFGLTAYRWGAEAEKARWILATQLAQQEHDREIAVRQAEIDKIVRNHSQAERRLAARVLTLQKQLVEQSDEDFLCPPGKPVFSERLRSQLDKIGRD